MVFSASANKAGISAAVFQPNAPPSSALGASDALAETSAKLTPLCSFLTASFAVAFSFCKASGELSSGVRIKICDISYAPWSPPLAACEVRKLSISASVTLV